MAKREWGVKRTCSSCGARFYDLRRDPIICPKCEATVDPLAMLRSQRTKVAAVAVVEKKPAPAPVVEEANDLELVDDDDLGDDVEIDDGADLDDDADADADDDAVLEDASELGEDKDDMFEVMDKVGDEDAEGETR